MTDASKQTREYFRRDQSDGISPPDPSKVCTFAEHIVRARGKRTNYTSVSLDPSKIRDFGDALYRLKRAEPNRTATRWSSMTRYSQNFAA